MTLPACFIIISIIQILTGLGSKKQPMHCLVSHGSIKIRDPPPVDFKQLCTWFQENPEGRVEGIVWHCDDGTLVKVRFTSRFVLEDIPAVKLVSSQVHRHHLGLTWPQKETYLGERPVVICVERTAEEFNLTNDLFTCFSRLNGQRFSRIQDIQFNLERILHFADCPDVSPEIQWVIWNSLIKSIFFSDYRTEVTDVECSVTNWRSVFCSLSWEVKQNSGLTLAPQKRVQTLWQKNVVPG